MRERTPLPCKGGKQPQRVSGINSQQYKDSLENSPDHECPTTHIFKTATEKGTRAARSESMPYQMASSALQGAEK